MKQRKKPRIGDVVLIVTDRGAAFAQYTHKDPVFGAVVRVIGPAPTDGEPEDTFSIAARPTQFVAFFALGPACHRGIAKILGPAPVPSEFGEFPTFRQALRLDPSSTGPCNWLIWNGHDEWTVPALTDEQRHYPIRAIINDTLLVDRTIRGWTSELEG